MNETERDAWLERRRTGIGGSDIAAILGLSPWTSALDVYLDKTGGPKVEPSDPLRAERMRWGNLLEDVVAREYAHRTGSKVQRVTAMLRHPEHAFALANIDRAVIDPGRKARVGRSGWLEGAAALLEVKTASPYAADEWGEEDAPNVPVHYAAQGMWYMGVAGIEVLHFACLIGGQRMITRTLRRDDAVLRTMFEAAQEFWHGNVMARRMPEPRDVRDILTLFPRGNGTAREIADEPELLDMVQQYREASEKAKEAKAASDALADALKMQIGAHDSLTHHGKALVTWRASKERNEIDWETAAKRLADLYESARSAEAVTAETVIAEAMTTTPGLRRFILKKAES